MGALIIGLLTGVVCWWGATWLKHKFGYDDSLDAFGVHGIGGFVGAVLTGVFAVEAVGGAGKAGLIDGNGGQVLTQLYGTGVVIVYDAIATFVIIKLIDLVIGIRVEKDVEREGLDVNLHGEAVL
jgi:Amt family ammonium transporter